MRDVHVHFRVRVHETQEVEDLVLVAEAEGVEEATVEVVEGAMAQATTGLAGVAATAKTAEVGRQSSPLEAVVDSV